MTKNKDNDIDEVYVGPYTFKIRFVEDVSKMDDRDGAIQDNGLDGLISYNGLPTIYVNKNLSSMGKKITILHEILHAIIDRSGIDSGTKQMEQMIEIVCHGIIQVVDLNPKLLKYIFNKET